MEKDYWLRCSLTGTAVGTIFENEPWGEKLLNCTTSEEVQQIFKSELDGRFDCRNGSIQQRGNAIWEEKYGLLSLFRGGSHLMSFPVSRSNFDNPLIEHYYPEIGRILDDGTAYSYLEWLSEDRIKIRIWIEEGDRGDEDGYGVEPDTWMVGFINKEGILQGNFQI